ncbi:MAG: DUF2789 family protein [Gammaproteobacteria bacterium]
MSSEINGYHDFIDLFAQLGLPNDGPSIKNFIASHRPLSSEIMLFKAPWWTPAQASFLRESIAEDANWAIAVDKLDVLLRAE